MILNNLSDLIRKMGHESLTELKSLLVDSDAKILALSILTVVVGVLKYNNTILRSYFCSVLADL